MVKPLGFKGDKKIKKRKREAEPGDDSSGSAKRPNPGSADAPAHDDDDGWVSADAVTDISGPILIVLPTHPPTSLACDANGQVFTIEIENIIDGNPSSAEPHDARQVWVANKIIGMDQFTFKGRYGKYLSSDKAGALTAKAAAVSSLESFKVATAGSPATFELRTLHDTLLATKEEPSEPSEPEEPSDSASRKRGSQPEVNCACLESCPETLLRLRMQARFKPQLRQSKEVKAKERISRRELEEAAGRRLDEDEVRRLKKARRDGDYHEQLLMIKVKNKHDKFS